MSKKYFDILGLNENATFDEVVLAHKNLVNNLNNQLDNSNLNHEEINKRISEINSAYDYLANNIFQLHNNEQFMLQNIRNLINANLLEEAREKIWKIKNRNAEWNYLVGQIYYKEGWYDKSHSHFEIAYNLEPTNIEYSQAYESFRNSNNQFRKTYSKRTMSESNSGCCNMCCTLLCMDACCESVGCDFISCC